MFLAPSRLEPTPTPQPEAAASAGTALDRLLADDGRAVDDLLDLAGVLVECLPGACLVMSPGGEIVALNRGAASLLDAQPPQPLRSRLETHLAADELPAVAGALAEGRPWRGGMLVRGGASAGLQVDARIEPVRSRDGRVLGAIARLQSLVPAQAADQVDAQTGLPNRAAIEARLAQMLAALDDGPRGFALFRIRLSGLASVRGLHGHEAVGTVLSTVAGRLKAATRASDLVGRFAEDELIVAAPIAAPDDAVVVAAKIERATGAAIRLDRSVVSIRACIGAALAPRDARVLPQLLSRASIVTKLSGV